MAGIRGLADRTGVLPEAGTVIRNYTRTGVNRNGISAENTSKKFPKLYPSCTLIFSEEHYP